MFKEYGGYIEWEYYSGKEYHDGYRFDSVRSAFLSCAKEKGYKHVLLPVYLCSCFCELFYDIGLEYSFYHIDKNFKPILSQKSYTEEECLFLVNYFGQLNEDYILEMSVKHNIFLDNTQDFFCKKIKGIDMANSCRKYLGVADGSYLYSTTILDMENYEYDSVIDKVKCLVGRFEKNASEYYKCFQKNEEIMRGKPIKRMSKLTQNILKSLDYNEIIQKRTSNFFVLDKMLSSYNELKIINNGGLFMYPLLVKNGMEIKNKLISKKIYTPTLWPGISEMIESNLWEKHLTDDIIWLPIDQRYNTKDMESISKMVCDLLG